MPTNRATSSLAAILILAACGPQKDSQRAGNTETPQPGWTYSTDKDEMRGTTAKTAKIESTNEVDFGFPYHTGQLTITLRKRPWRGLSMEVAI